jgi:uncharacterized membrane protein YtjA (UPF0391 family)
MIGLGLLFLIVALVAWILGATGVASFATGIAKFLIVAGIVVAVIFLLFGGFHYHGSVFAW